MTIIDYLKNNKDLIALIINIFSSVVLAILGVVISIIFHRKQAEDSKTAKTVTCLTVLYPEYKKIMKKIYSALKEAKKLKKYLEKCKENQCFASFNKKYYSKNYNSLRKVHYFFELIGVLARQDAISKNTLWHYFSFPLEYFIKTKDIRKLIWDNYCLPSYGENFCRLFVMYNDARKKAGMKWICNGKKIKPFNEAKVIEFTGNYNKFIKL